MLSCGVAERQKRAPPLLRTGPRLPTSCQAVHHPTSSPAAQDVNAARAAHRQRRVTAPPAHHWHAGNEQVQLVMNNNTFSIHILVSAHRVKAGYCAASWSPVAQASFKALTEAATAAARSFSYWRPGEGGGGMQAVLSALASTSATPGGTSCLLPLRATSLLTALRASFLSLPLLDFLACTPHDSEAGVATDAAAAAAGLPRQRWRRRQQPSWPGQPRALEAALRDVHRRPSGRQRPAAAAGQTPCATGASSEQAIS